MKKLTLEKCYYVEWIDSADFNLGLETGETIAWMKRETLKRYPPMKFASVGLLVENRKDCIILAGSYSLEKDDVSNVQLVPKGCIVTIERLYRYKEGNVE